ncbi:MAG TPA: PD-(D/E)XK nuclease family protein [Actinomycetota bacterium]|nr:PD-(D/E)XK nuclease family protein [Actinomycetota bacterium]
MRTPVQERTLVELMGSRSERPVFPAALAEDLRADLDRRLAAVASYLREGEHLVAKKSALTDIHQRCEGLFVANTVGESTFEYGFPLAVGKVVHKAVEVGVYAPGLAESDLVDRVLERLGRDDPAFASFLATLDPIDRSELQAEAVRQLVVFRSTFPPLEKAWTPSVEMSLKVMVADGKVLLHARPDLCLGGTDHAEPMRARRLILELKTGFDRPEHDEDVRLYALVATLFFGVPPFRVATVSLENGTWRAQEVTEDLLRGAVRRVADGCVRAAELLAGSEPALRAGRWCGWCPRNLSCPASSVRQEAAAGTT